MAYYFLKKAVKTLLPYGLVRIVQKHKQARTQANKQAVIEYSGPYADWASARKAAVGYDAPNIIAKVLASTQAVIDGRAVYERDSVLFYQEEYNWQFLSSLLVVAQHAAGRLKVVDFGGALGSSFWQNRKIFDKLGITVDWRVVEQDTYLQAAKQLRYDAPLRFYATIGDACADGKPDVVVFSSVLQYIEDYKSILLQAISAQPDYLIIDRTPTLTNSACDGKDGLILVQNVSPEIYSASYACWAFAPDALPNCMPQDYHQVYAYTGMVDGQFTIQVQPEAEAVFGHKGWLYKRLCGE